MKRLRHLPLLLTVAVMLAACASGDGRLTIQTDGMRFVQAEVRVQAGQPVTLRVVNRDGYAHAFDLDEFDLHAPLPAGATFEANFTPAEPGRYRFYCGSPGHAAAGMAGVLVVEP
jgi:plastocyanin